MPRTIRQADDLVFALNESREAFKQLVNTVKGFADANLLKFDDLETDKVWWSATYNQLVFEFCLDTTSIFSTKNEEYANTTFDAILSFVTRGMESFAQWERLRYSEVRIVRCHWFNHNKFVVTYGTPWRDYA